MIKLAIAFIIGALIGSKYHPSLGKEEGYLYIYWTAKAGVRNKKKLFKWFL